VARLVNGGTLPSTPRQKNHTPSPRYSPVLCRPARLVVPDWASSSERDDSSGRRPTARVPSPTSSLTLRSVPARTAANTRPHVKILLRHVTECGAWRICGADLNGDNLRISNCGSEITVGLWLRLELGLGYSCGLLCVQTAGESDKMRINHVIKTDQWRAAPQFRPAPHFVVSQILNCNENTVCLLLD